MPRVVHSWPLFLDQPHVTFLVPLERPPLFRSRFGGFEIGSKSVQNRFEFSSKLVRNRFEIGSKSVRNRFEIGSNSVRIRFEFCSKSVRGFEIGSNLVRSLVRSSVPIGFQIGSKYPSPKKSCSREVFSGLTPGIHVCGLEPREFEGLLVRFI